MVDIKLPIYLDYHATTPVDKRVLNEMLPFFSKKFGNPSSKEHKFGWEAEAAIDIAREEIAEVINCNHQEIIFTSGATESNNLAIKGIADFYKEKKNHIITSSFEHKCVIESCRHMENLGFKVTYLPINNKGFIDLKILEDSITSRTLLVSIMAVNNEIGTIQPLEKIGQICKDKNVVFHTDAAQAIGKIKIDVEKMNIDLMSMSSHKVYGPKGVGALYLRKRPSVFIKPIMYGGGQEKGLRPGTLPAALIVGFGKAVKIANLEMDQENKNIKALRDMFLERLENNDIKFAVAGDLEERVAGNINISFDNIDSESFITKLNDIAISTGSACSSNVAEPSYVLKAIGMDKKMINSSLRIAIGRYTNKEEMEYTVNKIITILKTK